MEGWDTGEEAGGGVVPGNRRVAEGSGNNVWRWVERAGGEEARLSEDIWWMDGKWQRPKGAWGITVRMSPEGWDTETDCDKAEENLKGQLQQLYPNFSISVLSSVAYPQSSLRNLLHQTLNIEKQFTAVTWPLNVPKAFQALSI